MTMNRRRRPSLGSRTMIVLVVHTAPAIAEVELPGSFAYQEASQ
jgi:hypothetical protein